MLNYIHRDNCRLCDSTQLDLVLPIRPSPIGDDFITEDKLSQNQETYPLDTYLCLACGHVQNLDVVNPEVLFRNYTYRTSVSLGLVEHFNQYAKEVLHTLTLSENSLVIEIGSNDGSLLKAFKNHGMRILGIDPARNIAHEATSAGIPTLPEFFTATLAEEIREKYGEADLICANNVFAHADNIGDIVKGIRHLLKKNGVFVFEVSYIPDMVDHLVFDTIYHEHVSHHALNPLEKFFNRFDMTLFDVKKINSKGGSIRAFAEPLSSQTRVKSALLKKLMADEQARGFLQPDIYRHFFKAIENCKQNLLNYIDQAIAQGKTIAAYGASTTTTTVLYHFELESRLKFIVDDNPNKQGMFSPGCHLPVFPSSELMTKQPDMVIILAWLYANTIVNKNQEYIDAGGEFIVPLPEMKIINKK